MGPSELWNKIEQADPDLAEQVRAKVQSYRDPVRNSAPWFVSNTLYHVAKLDGFEMSDTDRVPSMKGLAYWEIARAV